MKYMLSALTLSILFLGCINSINNAGNDDVANSESQYPTTSVLGKITFEDEAEGTQNEVVLIDEEGEETVIELDDDGNFEIKGLPRGKYCLAMKNGDGEIENLVKGIPLGQKQSHRLTPFKVGKKRKGEQRRPQCIKASDNAAGDNGKDVIAECPEREKPSEECIALHKSGADSATLAEAGCPLPRGPRKKITEECVALHRSGADSATLVEAGCPLPRRPKRVISEECKALFESGAESAELEEAGCPLPRRPKKDVSEECIALHKSGADSATLAEAGCPLPRKPKRETPEECKALIENGAESAELKEAGCRLPRRPKKEITEECKALIESGSEPDVLKESGCPHSPNRKGKMKRAR